MNMFLVKKKKITEQLSTPVGKYTDLSPKGSVDEGIRDLINGINGMPGLVTTSSCAGRISVYLEGRVQQKPGTRSSFRSGGKGGGSWLFVSHSPLSLDSTSTNSPTPLHDLFRLQPRTEDVSPVVVQGSPLVHVKFEAMILHLIAESLGAAQKVLSAALQAGFRESGAMNIGTSSDGPLSVSPTVAVRSAGLAFDSVVGYQNDSGKCLSLVDETYLSTLIEIANQRFETNQERIARFRSLLFASPSISHCHEDVETRRARKREEGLSRQQALQQQSDTTPTTERSTCEAENNLDDFDLGEMYVE